MTLNPNPIDEGVSFKGVQRAPIERPHPIDEGVSDMGVERAPTEQP
mgnify:CR=1 FL=1